MVGSFQTDFGSIYRHPGHEVYHKWGELINKNVSDEEYSTKGYVKFDIILNTTMINFDKCNKNMININLFKTIIEYYNNRNKTQFNDLMRIKLNLNEVEK